jgi:hypothetical protein
MRNIPCDFCASRDGNTPADFRAKCDIKGATILHHSEQILGGYNPTMWDSSNT